MFGVSDFTKKSYLGFVNYSLCKIQYLEYENYSCRKVNIFALRIEKICKRNQIPCFNTIHSTGSMILIFNEVLRKW